MNALMKRLLIVLAIGLLTFTESACTVVGDGFAGNGNVGVGLDYYEPLGFDFGGWGPGYGIGPYHDGSHRFESRGSGSAGHAYRSAPSSRAIPSIPSQGRLGGGRASGGKRR
jgi:hypothetical protein